LCWGSTDTGGGTAGKVGMYTNGFVTAPSFGLATVYSTNSSGSGCDTNYISLPNNTGCMITHDYSG